MPKYFSQCIYCVHVYLTVLSRFIKIGIGVGIKNNLVKATKKTQNNLVKIIQKVWPLQIELYSLASFPLWIAWQSDSVTLVIQGSTNKCTRSWCHKALWIKISTISDLKTIGTFVEWPASQNISSVGEAMPSGTDGSVLRWAWFGTLLAVDTPGSTHWTAAHVHTVSSWQRLATLILVPLQVALLTTHI